jgi:hypothetical protein
MRIKYLVCLFVLIFSLSCEEDKKKRVESQKEEVEERFEKANQYLNSFIYRKNLKINVWQLDLKGELNLKAFYIGWLSSPTNQSSNEVDPGNWNLIPYYIYQGTSPLMITDHSTTYSTKFFEFEKGKKERHYNHVIYCEYDKRSFPVKFNIKEILYENKKSYDITTDSMPLVEWLSRGNESYKIEFSIK